MGSNQRSGSPALPLTRQAEPTMLERTRSAQERWDERVNACPVALTRSLFPDDAVAVIYKPCRSPMTSGRARTLTWKLRFEPRSARLIEPLMGWTSSEDTLSEVELSFPTMQAAVAYARRQGLQFVVRGVDDVGGNIWKIDEHGAAAQQPCSHSDPLERENVGVGDAGQSS